MKNNGPKNTANTFHLFGIYFNLAVKYNPDKYLTGFVRPKPIEKNYSREDVADYGTSFVFTFCLAMAMVRL